MFDYAKEVDRLREMKIDDAKRIRIGTKHALNFGYSFAVGHVGRIVGYRMVDDVKQNKIFTGTRIWFVPEEDCIELNENKK